MTPLLPWTAPDVPAASDVEARAAEWVRPYSQAHHLARTRDWLVWLLPDASAELRIAALTHDVERMYPGGPVLDHAATDWDSPFYLYPHMLRSAEIVGFWLAGLGTAGLDVAEVRRLVGLHEVGGRDGADEVQAADSLSYLETLAGLTAGWVSEGRCSRDKGIAKLTYMAGRVRVPAAREPIAELLEWAIAQLPGEDR